MSKFRYIVTHSDADCSIKELVRNNFSFSSRMMARIKRANCIYLNGEPVRLFIVPNPGDVIDVDLPEEHSDFIPQNIPVIPVFEDDDLLIINKPAGYVVHPTAGHPVNTMANGIAKYIIDTNQSFKVRFINRLDMDTSGLLIIAKNAHCQETISKQMKAGQVSKKYIALVTGILEKETGTVDLPIGRPDPERVERGVMENGHPSVTHYTVLRRFKQITKTTSDSSTENTNGGFSLVELSLETGRTHQIRVHMSHIGHPIVSDHLYGKENARLIERQALHAHFVSFYHPATGEFMELSAEIPADIQNLIRKLEKSTPHL